MVISLSSPPPLIVGPRKALPDTANVFIGPAVYPSSSPSLRFRVSCTGVPFWRALDPASHGATMGAIASMCSPSLFFVSSSPRGRASHLCIFSFAQRGRNHRPGARRRARLTVGHGGLAGVTVQLGEISPFFMCHRFLAGWLRLDTPSGCVTGQSFGL